MEKNKVIKDRLKFIVNFVGVVLVVGIALGFSTFIFGESNKVLNSLGRIFTFLFYVSAFVLWIVTLIHSAKNKKWGWFVGILLLNAFGSVIYYALVYKPSITTGVVVGAGQHKAIKSLAIGIGVGIVIADILILYILYSMLPTLALMSEGFESERNFVIYSMAVIIIFPPVLGYFLYNFLKLRLQK